MEELRFTTESIAGMITQGVLMILIPVILVIVWKVKTHERIWLPVLVGAAAWFLFAILLKTAPAYFLIQADNPVARAIRGNNWLLYLTAGLLAGVFEETGRFLAFKTVLKKRRGSRTAISYGIGHGGFESAYIGFQTVSLAVVGILMNAGLSALVLGNADEATAVLAVEQLGAYTDLSFGTCLLGVFERIPAIALHISLSVFVFAAAREKRFAFLYPAAILYHALTDFSIVLYKIGALPIWGMELLLAALAVFPVIGAVRLYRSLRRAETKDPV